MLLSSDARGVSSVSDTAMRRVPPAYFTSLRFERFLICLAVRALTPECLTGRWYANGRRGVSEVGRTPRKDWEVNEVPGTGFGVFGVTEAVRVYASRKERG